MPTKTLPKKNGRKTALKAKEKGQRKLSLLKANAKTRKPAARPAKARIGQPEAPVAIYEVIETEVFSECGLIIDVEEEEVAG